MDYRNSFIYSIEEDLIESTQPSLNGWSVEEDLGEGLAKALATTANSFAQCARLLLDTALMGQNPWSALTLIPNSSPKKSFSLSDARWYRATKAVDAFQYYGVDKNYSDADRYTLIVAPPLMTRNSLALAAGYPVRETEISQRGTLLWSCALRLRDTLVAYINKQPETVFARLIYPGMGTTDTLPNWLVDLAFYYFLSFTREADLELRRDMK